MAGTSDERPAPSAIGTLESRPLVHLLVYARNRRLTGRLEVHAPNGDNGTLDLWRGRIHAARTVPPVTYFGALAYELGHIDTATLDATLLEISKSKRLHGEVLIERGSLTPAQRDAILGEQLCRKVHHLFSLPPQSTFAFYDAKPSLEEPPFTLDPIAPAWRGLREHPPAESVGEVLARYGTTYLRLANEGPLAQAGLDAEETALCEAITWKPMTLSQMRATSSLPGKRVELLVYLLVITKCAEPTTSQSSSKMPAVAPPPSSSRMLSAAPVSGSMPVPPPPSSQPTISIAPDSSPRLPSMPRTISTPGMRASSIPAGAAGSSGGSSGVSTRTGEHASLSFKVPSAPAIRTAHEARGSSPPRSASDHAAPVFSPADLGAMGIAHRASIIGDESPYDVLGLPTGASVDAARSAYFRLSKLWHPDRLPADLAPFRGEVETIFDAMTRAHRVLTDPDARRDFLAGKTLGKASLAPQVERPRRDVIRDIDAALSKRDFETAENLARQLASLSSEDSEAHALAAWASTLAGEASEETLRAAIPMLDKAVNNDRDCERAVYYRGLVHKRLGNGPAAFRDFSRVAQLNPKHVDAQRELRIFEMRARKGGSGEHALDSIISKTKKK